MRRLRRAQQHQSRLGRRFKRRMLAAGTAAAISLAAGTSPAQSPAPQPGDKHQIGIRQDADRDFLTDREEVAMGYRPFAGDQNDNGLADGAELALRLAAAVAQLPAEEDVTDPNQIYTRVMATLGSEACAVCGQFINMGTTWVVNPRLSLAVEFPMIATHYMEHGAFSYAGDVHQGRVDVPALSRALEIRFPYEPDDHQLPLDARLASTGQIAPDANDLDRDGLADSEELAAGLNLYEADQNDNLRPDGIDLARRCAEAIDRLPIHDPNTPDVKGVYKISYMMRGLEWCQTCGESVNMGYWTLVDPASDVTMDVPEIARHYMEHGSFSYMGTLHSEGRVEIAALAKLLGLPAYCTDLGALHLPGDLNGDCQIDLADFSVLAQRWLDSTDPAQE